MELERKRMGRERMRGDRKALEGGRMQVRDVKDARRGWKGNTNETEGIRRKAEELGERRRCG